jgi:hypothetical protein
MTTQPPQVTPDDLKALAASTMTAPVLVLLDGEATIVPRLRLADGTYPAATPVLTRASLYDWLFDDDEGLDDEAARFGAGEINRDLEQAIAETCRELGWGRGGLR